MPGIVLTLEITALACAVILLQWHGIEYWSEGYSELRGVVFSLSLEVATLLLYYRRRAGLTVLAVLCSVLLIAGPLRQVMEPALDRIAAADLQATLSSEISDSMAQEAAGHRRTLEQYLANSADRSGWLGATETARTDFARANAAYRESLAAQAQASQAAVWPWREWAGLIIYALGLVFLQLTQITIIRTWGARYGTVDPRIEPNHPTEPPYRSGPNDRTIPDHTAEPPYQGGPKPQHGPVPASASPEEKVRLVAAAVRAGAFGDQPGVNRISQTMKVRKVLVGMAMEQLEREGVVSKNGRKWVLSK